jgi:hypothetical protein
MNGKPWPKNGSAVWEKTPVGGYGGVHPDVQTGATTAKCQEGVKTGGAPQEARSVCRGVPGRYWLRPAGPGGDGSVVHVPSRTLCCLRIMENARFSARIGHTGRIVKVPIP